MAMAPSSKLKLYVDLMSQPSRAVLLFCRLNNIDVKQHLVNIQKGEQEIPEFREINPLGKVPCMVDGRFKLAESHAIMEYLSSTRPGVADHWYPTDAQRRGKIQSVLDWHHLNLRRGSMTVVFNKALAPMLGLKADPRAAAEGLAILKQSFDVMETIWLQEGYPFLAGGRQPSIADLSLVCEIMQLQVLGNGDVATYLSSKESVTAWLAAVKKATAPHFDDVHKIIYKVAARRSQETQQVKAGTGVSLRDQPEYLREVELSTLYLHRTLLREHDEVMNVMLWLRGHEDSNTVHLVGSLDLQSRSCCSVIKGSHELSMEREIKSSRFAPYPEILEELPYLSAEPNWWSTLLQNIPDLRKGPRSGIVSRPPLSCAEPGYMS